MSGRIIRRAAARRDLRNHFEYLAEEAGTETAKRFRQAAADAMRRLADPPLLGVRREFLSAALAEVRIWPMRPFPQYLICYEPLRGGIRVLRVIHSRQDYLRVFRDEE